MEHDRDYDREIDGDSLPGRLRWMRARKRWKQADLARYAGVSVSTVGMVESGARLNKGSIPQIADALGVSYGWLMHGRGHWSDGPPVQYDEANAALSAIKSGASEAMNAGAREQLGHIRPSPFRGLVTGPKATAIAEFATQVAEINGEPEAIGQALWIGRNLVLDYAGKHAVVEFCRFTTTASGLAIPIGYERKVIRLMLAKALDPDSRKRYAMVLSLEQDADEHLQSSARRFFERAQFEFGLLGVEVILAHSAEDAAAQIKTADAPVSDQAPLELF